MTPSVLDGTRVLAVDPTSKGFGFAVLEGPARPIDWGLRQANGDRNRDCVKQAGELIARYRPDVLLVEDTSALGSRRCARVRELTADFRMLALEHGIRLHRISRRKVQRVFAATGASTKHQIALAIAKRFPELDPRLPPLRKPWMSEDERMAIFDAVAMALAFYIWLERRRQGQPAASQSSFLGDAKK